MTELKMLLSYIITVTFVFLCSCSSSAQNNNSNLAAYLNKQGIEVSSCNIADISEPKLQINKKSLTEIKISSSKDCHIPYSLNGEYVLFVSGHDTIGVKKLTQPKVIYNDSGTPYIGGYEIDTHNKGNYVIYIFKDEKVEKVFESDYLVFNYSLDCESICGNGFLTLNTIDQGKDGIPDLAFSGNVCFYCQGEEYGFSRLDRKPLKKEPFERKYYSEKKGEIITWSEEK